GDLLVYPSPWRTTVKVSTTSGANVSLIYSGIVEREEEDVVEFVRGAASVAYPIDSIVSVEWLSEVNGGVSFEPYSSGLTTGTSVNEGYGLARIKYKTKAIVYRTALPVDVPVQFVLEDLS
ncbi:MAG: hypothetical protein LPH21_08785, partial [Shewanella sp.]|nr:hypothetical protein [Shewanella sp.]